MSPPITSPALARRWPPDAPSPPRKTALTAATSWCSATASGRARFGGKPDVVGRTIQIDGQPYLVVGVIGRGFVTEPAGDLWLPFQFDLTSQDMAHYFAVAARLKPGITLQQANAQLKLAADQFRRDLPWSARPARWLRSYVSAGIDRGRHTLVAAGTARRCGTGSAYRLRQRCQSSARSRLGQEAGARHARRAWRRPLADRPAVAHREPGALADRRLSWSDRSGLPGCACCSVSALRPFRGLAKTGLP